jgi:WD40 repeat protein
MNNIFDEFKSSKASSFSFNQDYSMFSMATERGFKIYPTYPNSEYYEKNLHGGLSKCEMNYNSNLLAVVGGGRLPKYNNKKVVIYNDEEERIECEFKFTTKVINVKFKDNLLFIVCEKKIYVFDVETSQNIDSFETTSNKRGIIAVNGYKKKTIMAHPIEFEDKPDKGYVGIKNYKTKKYFPLLVHEEPISYMEMDFYGLLLATANDKGTIVRIHSCEDKTLLYECRRGKDKTIINFISFDIEYKYIGLSSEKGTIHIWKLDDIIETKIIKRNNTVCAGGNRKVIANNTKDDFASVEKAQINIINDDNVSERNSGVEEYRVKKIKNYKSETSFAKIRLNKSKCIFCFEPSNIVIIISSDEKYFFTRIDPKKGGYCLLTEGKNLTENSI